MKKILIHVTFSLILFFVAVSFISPLVFSVSDVGLRYLQIENLIEQDWRTFAIDYPAEFIDPNLEFVPYYYAYSVINQRIFLNISPYLPLFSSVLLQIVGLPGLAIIPVLGAIFIGWAIKELFHIHDLPNPNLMFWLTIFITPILFYSLQIWDHTLGVALSTWGVYFVVRGLEDQQNRNYLIGGLCLGLGVGQRPELYAFTIALFSSMLIVQKFNLSKILSFIQGFIIGVLPIWITQYLWLGHPLGTVAGRPLFGHGEPQTEYPSSQLANFTKPNIIVDFLYQIDPFQPALTLLTLLLFILGLCLIYISLKKMQINNLFYCGLAIFIAGYLLILHGNWGEYIKGFLTTFHLIPFSLVLIPKKELDHYRTWPGYKFINLTVVLFSAILIIFWPGSGGKQWGSRYLLPIYPLMFYMAIFSYVQIMNKIDQKWRSGLKAAMIILIFLSVIFQVMSVYSLQTDLSEQIAIREWIKSLPAEFILTNAPYLQSYMVSIDEVFLYVYNIETLTDALGRLAEKEISQAAIIPLDEIRLDVPDTIPGYRVDGINDFIYRLSPKKTLP